MIQLSMFVDPVDEKVRALIHHRVEDCEDIKSLVDWWLNSPGGGCRSDFCYVIQNGVLYADEKLFGTYNIPPTVRRYTKQQILEIAMEVSNDTD